MGRDWQRSTCAAAPRSASPQCITSTRCTTKKKPRLRNLAEPGLLSERRTGFEPAIPSLGRSGWSASRSCEERIPTPAARCGLGEALLQEPSLGAANSQRQGALVFGGSGAEAAHPPR